MAEEGSQLRPVDSTDNEEDNSLQPADFPISLLASLHLSDKDVVINESTYVDNPEPHSVFPVTMSSLHNQSQQQMDKSLDTRPEPSPAVQSKIKDA